MRSAHDGALALARELASEGGPLARSARPPAPGTRESAQPGPPQLAVRGPRVAGHEDEYELLLEMILEGSLLHYGAPRVTRAEDADHALLLGDQLYALGLSRLAGLGDLDAVAELADLISMLAAARAAGDEPLAEAVWRASAHAIGWGGGEAHAAAKRLARAGDPAAAAALAATVTGPSS